MMDWVRGKSNASGVGVHADRGGLAAGRDIRDNKFGLDEEETGRRLAEAQEPLVARLEALTAQVAREKGVPTAPLLAVLAKLGEKGVPELEIPARLDAAADQLIELRAQLARLRNDRPEFAVIREQALALIDRGDFDAARAVLNRGREAASALREETSRNEAQFLADEARIDHLQLAYRDAAQKYTEAAALVANFDPDAEWQYVLRQASELDNHGNEFGDNQALVEAIGVYRRGLTLAPRKLRPLDWAGTQNNLGIALGRLGERESGAARLEEAVAAYHDALQEWTRERVPLDWARTQSNLGNALQALGERESGTARLKEAVAAYRKALEELTRDRVPPGWAATQNNLGDALRALGLRESGTARLEESVAAYHDALQEWTRERVPLQWAMSTGSQGVALNILAERRGDLAMAEQAQSQIEAAFQLCREAHHERRAACYEALLSLSQLLVERLRKGI